MKSAAKLPLLLTLVLVMLFAFPYPAMAQSPDGDQVVLGGSFKLESGQTLNGSLAIFGGSATIEEGAHVNGDILLTGGSLDVFGQVDGSVTAVGGSVNLGDTAVVNGDLNTLGASLKRAENAVIRGNINMQNSNGQDITIPGIPKIPTLPEIPGKFSSPDSTATWLQGALKSLGNILWGFLQALAISALAMLITLFFSKHTERIGQTVVAQPAVSAGLGLLTIIVAPGLLILLAITIILIPASLLGILVLGASVLFGWIAIGLEIGKRLEQTFNVDWPPAVSAGVGTLLLTLVTGVIGWIPCIGWMAPALVAFLGLGGVLMTRFGTRLPDEVPLQDKPAAPSAPAPLVPQAPQAAGQDSSAKEDLPDTDPKS